MVKVAFIVEGKIEKIFVDFLDKSRWFEKYNIKKVAPTIDAKGGGNLCPHNMQIFVDEVKTLNILNLLKIQKTCLMMSLKRCLLNIQEGVYEKPNWLQVFLKMVLILRSQLRTQIVKVPSILLIK